MRKWPMRIFFFESKRQELIVFNGQRDKVQDTAWSRDKLLASRLQFIEREVRVGLGPLLWYGQCRPQVIKTVINLLLSLAPDNSEGLWLRHLMLIVLWFDPEQIWVEYSLAIKFSMHSPFQLLLRIASVHCLISNTFCLYFCSLKYLDCADKGMINAIMNFCHLAIVNFTFL